MIILLFTKCIDLHHGDQVVKNGFESDISFIVLTKFQKLERATLRTVVTEGGFEKGIDFSFPISFIY